MLFNCTGCDKRSRAEYKHGQLHVPLCGFCFHSYQHADFSYISQYCIWCGEGDDGREVFICDTCPNAFCNKCILRNFSPSESQRIRDCNPWSCYLCLSTFDLNKLKVPDDFIFYNLETAYDKIHHRHILTNHNYGPKRSIALLENLSNAERIFLSIFYTGLTTSQLVETNLYSNYLKASDLYSKIYCISKNLYNFFRNEYIIHPCGLFKTEHGTENDCQLYLHQQTSLYRMKELENKSCSFGSLRGGILADEPGLGKTVTMIALCLSTAGALPKQPSNFWDIDKINDSWKIRSQSGVLYSSLVKLVNSIVKILGKKKEVVEIMSKLGSLQENFPNIEEFYKQVKLTIWKCDSPISLKETALSSFKYDLMVLKSLLEKRNKYSKSKRLLYERSLRPSCGTLIIVPLVLLEHWYEQFTRHVGLEYLTQSNEDNRGVVYIDGLGDIVDVEAPLPKVILWSNMNASAELLSNYLFVITTFERCANLEYVRKKLGFDDIENDFVHIESSLSVDSNLEALRTFLGIRWLRLVVDEGHELSARKTNVDSIIKESFSASNSFITAADFICDIAAERRWVMSGTPTTGTSSVQALTQLQRLLKFLRHDRYGIDENKYNQTGVTRWNDEVIRPLLIQTEYAWNELLDLLGSIIVRHTKADLKLFDPIKNLVVLDAIHNFDSPLEEESRSIDRAMAKYIADTMYQAKLEYQRNVRLSNSSHMIHSVSRKPKAIVFSQSKADLEGTGHFLYLDTRFGNRSVCEHDGTYKSAELSRFRHSKKKYRLCPLCGHENLIFNQSCCDNTLLLVEYITSDVDENMDQTTFTSSGANGIAAETVPVPCEGGHGINGKGGHFLGRCLCSPEGCNLSCKGYVNAIGPTHFNHEEYSNPNIAIVSENQVVGWTLGMQWQVNQLVRIIRSEENERTILWRGGQYGGLARIKMWRKCGGKSRFLGWHGTKPLDGLKWQTMDEDASILLLHKDGSHGLDLNFVTHIFLLEKIKDPALENQIISRAHRMGAKGPVKVIVLQVNSEK